MALTDYVIMPSADYQAACNKLREKTGKTDLIKSGDMAKEIEEMSWINLLEFDDLAISILDGSITSITNDTITVLPAYALAGCVNLTYAKFENATIIGEYGFENDSALVTIECPKVTSINSGMLGSNTFSGCTSLSKVELPLVETLGRYCFENCTSLISISLPSVTSIDSNVFQGCTALTSVDTSSLTSIDSKAFSDCSALNTLILRNTDAVCTNMSDKTFENTPFAVGGTGGTVYVPEALIESYKIAENWSILYDAGTCNFIAIEGSEYDGGEIV